MFLSLISNLLVIVLSYVNYVLLYGLLLGYSFCLDPFVFLCVISLYFPCSGLLFKSSNGYNLLCFRELVSLDSLCIVS